MTNTVPTILLAEWSFQSASYVPTGNNDLSTGSPTVVDLSLSSILDTAAKNSDQVDLGATLPAYLDFIGALEWFAAVTAGLSVDFWWSGSANSNVAAGNPGHPDGADGAWTGDGGGTVAETVGQLIHIGSFQTTDLVGVQIAHIGGFAPKFRYGQLITVNDSGTTLCATDDIESSVLAYGTVKQIQNTV